jgi:hypothetical protein
MSPALQRGPGALARWGAECWETAKKLAESRKDGAAPSITPMAKPSVRVTSH